MLSRDDYKKYLDEMVGIENHMIDVYQDCFSRIDDEKIKEIFARLLKDERRHAFMVREIKKIFITD